MIVKKKRTWFQMLATLQGTTLRVTFSRIVLITAASILVTFVELYTHIETYTLTVTPFALIGVALGIFLGFRNNAAYDRFWEGRKLWGALVNVTRSFARQVSNLVVADDNPWESERFHQELIHRTIAFVHALRHHLRDTSPLEDIAEFIPADDMEAIKSQKNMPLFLLRRMGERIREAWRQGWIDTYHVQILEGSLTEMTTIQGACERIKNTPIPFAYTVLTHRIVAFYCFSLPFGIVDSVGILTPVVVFLISHAFLGLDAIGDEIEQPFGTEPQHLPLSSLCRTIEVNLRQHNDEDDTPDFMAPIDDVLI